MSDILGKSVSEYNHFKIFWQIILRRVVFFANLGKTISASNQKNYVSENSFIDIFLS